MKCSLLLLVVCLALTLATSAHAATLDATTNLNAYPPMPLATGGQNVSTNGSGVYDFGDKDGNGTRNDSVDPPGLDFGSYRLYTDNGSNIILNLNGGDMTGTATITNLDTHCGVNAGAVVVTNVHDITIGKIDTRFTVGNYISAYGGAITIGSAASPAGNVTIGGLESSGYSWSGGSGGNVTIYGGDVLIRHGTTNDDILSTSAMGLCGGTILITSAGSFGVRDIKTYGDTENYARGGDVTLIGTSSGTCTIRDIATYTTRIAKGGLVTIRGYNSVSIRAIDTHGYKEIFSAPWRGAGNVTITNIVGDIAITGAIDLRTTEVPATYPSGYLNLQAGGNVTVSNLDLSKLSYAAFDANGASYITGLLTGTNGAAATGAADIGATLRTPSGKQIRYLKKANPALGGQSLTLADKGGTPGAGGRLRPWPSAGTVVIFK